MNISRFFDDVYDALPSQRKIACIGKQTFQVAGTLAGSTLAVIGAVGAVTQAVNQTAVAGKTIDTIVLGGAGRRTLNRLF